MLAKLDNLSNRVDKIEKAVRVSDRTSQHSHMVLPLTRDGITEDIQIGGFESKNTQPGDRRKSAMVGLSKSNANTMTLSKSYVDAESVIDEYDNEDDSSSVSNAQSAFESSKYSTRLYNIQYIFSS